MQGVPDKMPVIANCFGTAQRSSNVQGASALQASALIQSQGLGATLKEHQHLQPEEGGTGSPDMTGIAI